MITDYKYLQLQPVDDTTDDSVSDLDQYVQDETIDLSADTDASTLEAQWTEIVADVEKDPEWFTFDNE